MINSNLTPLQEMNQSIQKHKKIKIKKMKVKISVPLVMQNPPIGLASETQNRQEYQMTILNY